jgi:NADH-quinone oxidoreductase subunit F
VTDRPLTERMRADGEAPDLRAYERAGGYIAARDALRTLSPTDIQARVTESGLRGRGGAGFPTGQKWSFVPMGPDAPHPKYLVVNADEMEPGTFKDRLLMEADPHQLLEGIILSAYAIEADVAYIFLRWAYKLSHARLARAIAEAYDAQYLGRRIFGSGYDLDVHLHVSAGRYICGEETALLNALEGKRGNPRSKPPFPAVAGLWGRPTIVNNVETICNVPHVIGRGADWFRKASATGEGGTKLYGASGRVKRPGLWELPLGTPIREILDEHAGGMREGVRFRGVLPGGASTDFLVDEHLDVAMDFESVQKFGSRLGTGTMIVLDDRTCPVGMIRNLEEFFAQESCGWCTPCWSGLHWVADILRDLEEGRGEMSDLDTLAAHARLLGPGHTFCALAPGAAEPLQSGLKHFRDDFERHVREHRCPWQ